MYDEVKERAVDPSPVDSGPCEGGYEPLPLKHTNIELTYDVWYPESVVAEIFGKTAIVRARKNGEVKYIRAAGCYRYMGGWLLEWLDRVALYNSQQATTAYIQKQKLNADAMVESIVNTQLTNAQVAKDCGVEG